MQHSIIIMDYGMTSGALTMSVSAGPMVMSGHHSMSSLSAVLEKEQPGTDSHAMTFQNPTAGIGTVLGTSRARPQKNRYSFSMSITSNITYWKPVPIG